MLLADAVQHLGGVEGARNGARPVIVMLERPAQQDAVNFVRIDEVAMLVDGADAVRVAVGAEASLTAVGHHGLAQGANVRLDGFGIDARKSGICVAANLHVSHAKASKNIG